MLFEPEFEDVNSVRKLAILFEEKEKFGEILDEYSNPDKLTINIGDELGVKSLQEYSLVTKDFSYKGEPLGHIGVLGPTRMRYSQVTDTINQIASLLDDYFEHF